MNLEHFVKTLRCLGSRAAMASCLGTTGLLFGSTIAFAEEPPIVTNVGRFQIPFDIDTEPGQPVAGFAVLFGSQDGGAHWEQLQTVPASQKAFMFSAPRDGRYSFAIRITDDRGNLQSAIQGGAPELDVVVDTAAPDLKLELFESGPGQVIVSWTSTDSAASPETLSIEYTDGADGRWKPLEFRAAASGQTMIPSSAFSVIAVRAAMMDTAGNRGEATSQIVIKPTAVNQVHSSLPMSGPLSARPLGPTPFGGNPISAHSGVTTVGTPDGTSFPSSTVAAYPQSTPQAASFDASSSLSGSFYAAAPAIPSQITESPSESGFPTAGEVQLVNNSEFEVDYQVEDVGPSGVSAVELFVTEDGGQQWFRYGNDPDLKSPFAVDVQGEGTYGFSVRIRNGLGFADTPPQPGQAPEIIVTVDQSVPIVEMAQPSVRSDGFGTIQIAWRVNEQHPAAAPVRLEHSTTPNGPWTPVFDWQADQGGYQWAVRPGTPSALFVRLLVRDAAGNVGVAQTAQPVIVDLKKPIGRLLRVQAASHSTVHGIQP